MTAPLHRVYLSDADYSILDEAQRDLDFQRRYDFQRSLLETPAPYVPTTPAPLTHPANLGQLDDTGIITDRGSVKGYRVLAAVMAISGALVVWGVWHAVTWVVTR